MWKPFSSNSVKSTQTNSTPQSGGNSASLRCHTEEVRNFRISGWAVDGDASISDLTLLNNGVPVNCSIVRKERRDVLEALGIKELETGFEIELPGGIWENASENGLCELELTAKKPLAAEPVIISREKAAGWIADISCLNPGIEKHYLSLLALEHIYYGNLLTFLTEETAGSIRGFAKKVQLNDLVAGGSDPQSRINGKPQKSMGRLADLKSRAKELPKARIESVRHFTISGWAVIGRTPVEDFEFVCNGSAVECSVIRKERQDVADALQIDVLETGFEIEIPGYIWDYANNGLCRLELYGDGHMLTVQPIELNRTRAAGWTAEIAQIAEEAGKKNKPEKIKSKKKKRRNSKQEERDEKDPEQVEQMEHEAQHEKQDPERQYLFLLALEHVRHGKLFSLLDPGTGIIIRSSARKMRLEDFVFEDEPSQAAEYTPAEDGSTLMLWGAMRELNSRLSGAGNNTYEIIKEVMHKKKMRGRAKEWYLNLAVQITCGSGEFLRLRELLDFGQLHQFEQSTHAHQLSLLLPALVADKHIDRAIDVIVRLQKSLKGSWLHTECVRFSVTNLQQLEAQGEVDIFQAEKFRKAFIGLLDAFEGDWFSRLHDRELMIAMGHLLADLDRYTDYHQREVVDAAIRHYGLNRIFWQVLSERVPVVADYELSKAEAAWKRIQSSIEQRRPTAEQFEEMLDPLIFFQRRGNPEAVFYMREIAANCLPVLNRTFNPAVKTVVSALLEQEPSEALRIAAFPWREYSLLSHFPETTNRLDYTVRRCSDNRKSAVYDLQCGAAATLGSANAAIERGNVVELKAALEALEQKAINLCNWHGMYLGIDLLASGVSLAMEAGLEIDALVMRLGELMNRAYNESRSDWYLPPPACAALARLASDWQNPVVSGFLREMRGLVLGKFSLPHNDLFSPVAAHALATSLRGWPQDTLVVICSCRAHLDTRIKAIRETWLQDLKVRGVPYVILVGDGDDTLQGDILALSVPDSGCDPKRTLRMFDWVYENTGAQYVLKINDDCYLNVARYFDSLSYRKHFYYGRVVLAGQDAPEQTLREVDGRKVIDKSPDQSVYTDGSLGYCLARHAIAQLRIAQAIDAGRRLVGLSHREDKLVGDLLALRYILPHNEDFNVFQRRCTFRDAMPVTMLENTFFPSNITPTKVVRSDSERDFALIHQRRTEETVWPKKIWPTYRKPELRANSNQLELLSDIGKVEQLLRNNLVVVCVLRNEMVMLPHFLQHYRKLGVGCFIFVDNASDDGSREFLVAQPDAVVYSADTEYRHSHYGVSWQQAIMGNHCLGKWVLLADADELLVYKDSETVPLADFVKSIDEEKCDGALIYMIDMYPYGDLAGARFEKAKPFEAASYYDKVPLIELRFGGGAFSNSRNFVNGLRHRIAPSRINAYVSQKYALFRYHPWIRLTEGVHYAANMRVSEQPVFFAHFKYHAGFKNKVLTEIKRKQHFNGAEEYHKYASMLSEGQGSFGAEGVTESYQNSDSFLKIADELNRQK